MHLIASCPRIDVPSAQGRKIDSARKKSEDLNTSYMELGAELGG